MTIGNGLIANGIQLSSNSAKEVLLFASGVSNSNETNPIEFNREKKLLIEAIKNNMDKTIIYISSCDVEDPVNNKKYYKHKLHMEAVVQNTVKNYYIFRLPQVVGKTNNENTLFNFLVNKINKNEQFDIWTLAKRNLIDIDDVNKVINFIIKKNILKNSIINIASSRNYSILEIVNKIENFLGKKAIYRKLLKGHEYKVDISNIKRILIELNLTFDETYLDDLLFKYIKIEDKDKNDE